MDEPFYAAYLASSGRADPGRDDILTAHETDPQQAAQDCLKNRDADYVFQKHMPLHMLSHFPLDWAEQAQHFFLLRHPRRVIASYTKVRPDAAVADLGFRAQRQLYAKLTDITGMPPPIIHSEDILKAPKAALSALCRAMDMSFDKAMLSWTPGAKPEDGVWAKYWYDNVINSSGFAPLNPKLPKLSPRYDDILKACEADYAALAQEALNL